MAGYHSVNFVLIVGRVGKMYPKETLPGSARVFMKINLVTEDVFRTGQKRKDWHRVYLWGADANFAEKYLTVGTLLAVQGALRTNYKSDRLKDNPKIPERMVVVEAQKMSVLLYNKAKEEKPEPAPEEEAAAEESEEA